MAAGACQWQSAQAGTAIPLLPWPLEQPASVPYTCSSVAAVAAAVCSNHLLSKASSRQVSSLIPTCSLLAGCQRAWAQVGGCSSSGAGAQRHAVPRALDGHSRPRPQERCLDPGVVVSGLVSDSSACGPHQLAAGSLAAWGPADSVGYCLSMAFASCHVRHRKPKMAVCRGQAGTVWTRLMAQPCSVGIHQGVTACRVLCDVRCMCCWLPAEIPIPPEGASTSRASVIAMSVPMAEISLP